MRALCWHGKGDIRCDTVPDPTIQNPGDVIIKVTSCAICGSDLHLMGGFVPSMKSGDIMGHETMGEVVEVGSGVTKFRQGDRIVVPFTISCGECRQCKMGNWSVCERTNPNGAMEAEQYGYTTAGLFGFSHMLGGYSGGQAEYLRVPHADIGPIKVPAGLDDEKVLFLSDIFPTGYQAAEHCDIKPTDTIVVFGCGPVGLFAIKSCFLLGAKRVIAVDDVPERLALARAAGAETIDRTDAGVQEVILEMTHGLGPDAVIEAVGMESHGGGTMQSIKSLVASTERPTSLQEAILAVRPCGILSLPGVFGGMVDNIPMGALVQKGIILRTGQTHVQRYLEPLMKLIEESKIDLSFLITHRVSLADGPEAYATFRDKKDGCVKVVMHPHG